MFKFSQFLFQFFLARDLSMAFIQTTILDRFFKHIDEAGLYESKEKVVLNELAYLYALTCLHSHLPHLLKFGIFGKPDLVGWINCQMVGICKQLKPNAMARADVLAPTDFVLNSALVNNIKIFSTYIVLD